MMKWLFVVFVILGDLMIIDKNRFGFVLWMICDGFFCINSCFEGLYPEATVFGIYAVLGILGFNKWQS